MTEEEIELVKTSWARIMPVSNQAAVLFYDKLFELDPSLKVLFPDDMEEQGKKLIKMINTVVNTLDRLDEVMPAIKAMGERHVGYGVKNNDYDTVGKAFIWTLSKILGETFTGDVKAAWLITYTILADTMKRAAAEVTV